MVLISEAGIWKEILIQKDYFTQRRKEGKALGLCEKIVF